MNLPALLTEIDAEISRLQRARTALLGLDATSAKRGPGRPKGTVQKTAKKRTLNAEARAKIAAAQKKRWAVAKKGRA